MTDQELTDGELVEHLEEAGHLEAAGALRRKLNAEAAVDPIEALEEGGHRKAAATMRLSEGFAETDPERVRLRRRRKITEEEADDE